MTPDQLKPIHRGNAPRPTGDRQMTYEITGGDHGNYKITEGGSAVPVAFVRRNQTGGGYTARLADDSNSVQMRNMPSNETSDQQAAEIMAKLLAACKS